MIHANAEVRLVNEEASPKTKWLNISLWSSYSMLRATTILPIYQRQAIGIVNESGSAPAAYHLARHLEAMGRTAEAVSFYARSSRFNHAIRLAKDHGMDSEV